MLQVLEVLSLIRKVYNLSNIMFIVILVLIGAGFLFLAVYLRVKDIRFKKNCIPVKMKVKETKEISSTENNNKIVHGYYTTFEFIVNGIKKVETISTQKKFKEGTQKEGLYDIKSNTLSIDGEEFYVSKGASEILFSFGFLILFLASYIIFNFKTKILVIVISLYFAVLFGGAYFIPIIFPEKKEKNKMYYKKTNNKEYSNVNGSLIRYIPKPQFKNIEKKYNKKNSFSKLLLLIIILISGSICTFVGIMGTYHSLVITLTYPSTIAKIEDVYKYTKEANDNTLELTGIVVSYTIDDNHYKINYKTNYSYDLEKYKAGKKIRIFYEKNNPNNFLLKSDLIYMVIPLVLGVMINYVSIYGYISNKRRLKLYETYILNKEAK